MTDFNRGQKGKLITMGCHDVFPIIINITSQGMDIDVSCFGLDSNDKLSDDRFMVFYNQKSCPGDAIVFDNEGNTSTFKTDISRLPDTIKKLVVTASINGDGTMRKLGSSSMRLGETSFAFSGIDFADEKAVIIGELYKRDGEWRFGAVGQGFNGGLSALLKHFGGSEATDSHSKPDRPIPEPEMKKVSLSKITLEKRGDKVSLEKKKDKGHGKIRVNLNWSQQTKTSTEKTSFLSRIITNKSKDKGIDLDLACLYEMSDGSKGLVQSLGNSWGSFTTSPYINLDSDDRSGASQGGENIFINGDSFDKIKRALIFTFIYEGVPNWNSTDGVVTIEVPEQPKIVVNLDQGGNQMLCAIAMIENNSGNFQVTKIIEYFSQIGPKLAHEIMDQKFGFGLRWQAGNKD